MHLYSICDKFLTHEVSKQDKSNSIKLLQFSKKFSKFVIIYLKTISNLYFPSLGKL